MDSTPGQLFPPGQRTLAAIVFTDVVGFSARMQANEEATLRLMGRDFGMMREICAGHHGSVLKTTGDGLLLYFPSAVQAVACALAMQRQFADHARNMAAADVLTHRVGIHLGDVFFSEQDVMGDGVNIAARLQAEAEPGGICISQTVYDVVKNKLELHVTSLGPRELKNISQSIPVYRLLLEAQAGGVDPVPPPAPAAAPASPPRPAGDPLAGVRRLLAGRWIRTGLLAAAGAVFLALVVAQLRTRAQLKRERQEAEIARAALHLALDEGAAAAEKDASELAGGLAGMRQQVQQLRIQYLDKYNFGGMALALRRQEAEPDAPAGLQTLRRTTEHMATMKDWVIAQLQRHNRDSPLVTRELSGTAPKELRVFAGADRQLYFVEGGAVRGRAWTQLEPDEFGAVVAGAILQGRPVPPREVVVGALAFARTYNLPELQTALRVRRSQLPPRK